MSTFIQGELQYTDNYLRQRTRLALARDFLTPETKYAGGVELYHTRERFYFEEYDTLELPYTENSVDLWAGRSFQLDKRTNFIFSTRVNTRDFVAQPFVSIDSNSFLPQQDFLFKQCIYYPTELSEEFSDTRFLEKQKMCQWVELLAHRW